MANPIRYLILTQIKAALEAITVAGGYRHTIVQVEIAAKGWNDPDVKDPDRLPGIQIIPQTEIIVEESFQEIMSDWTMDVIAHFTVPVVASDLDLDAALACMNMSNDVRKALYADPELGIDEVISMTIKTRTGTEGAHEAAQRQKGSIHYQIVVRFLENITDD